MAETERPRSPQADGPPGHDAQLAPGQAGDTATGATRAAPQAAGDGGLPSISLPTGGGAIRGIDEKLTVAQATGTASLTVSVFTSAARQGSTPKLALSYDSGAGNGPFGLGWQLPVPAIARKTSNGLPRYDDAADSDVMILSGAEDLVPLLAESEGAWSPLETTRALAGTAYQVRGYRPRVESEFARIERWEALGTGEVHWRTISKTNLTSLYGRDATSRIADPRDPARVFSWLLDLSYDDRGNAISYVYKEEDGSGAPAGASELNRTITANRYLKRVRYGNEVPYLPAGAALPALPSRWCFELVLDYGEHDLELPTPQETVPWACRADPFSSYRSGFELRTYRTCRRLLMFHQLQELGEQPVLVRSTDIVYQAGAAGDPTLPLYTQLASIAQTGWVAKQGGGYETEALPPLQFGYSPLAIDERQRTADAQSLQNIVGDIGGARERWIDLDGEGLQGILTEDDGAWYYKRNVSAWNPDGGPAGARFEPLTLVSEKPSLGSRASPLMLTDLNGDGNMCAVSLAADSPGWFEYDADRGWAPFRELQTTASIDWASPDLRFVDLNGDGLADVLVTEDDAFTWYEWIPESGFAPAERIAKAIDEERGPALVLADSTGSIFLADMSGDGLADLVRIRSGEVCYWPNLGYGRYGAKVAMDGAPAFDYGDRFDPRRIRLADIDGSGTADLIYLGAQATIWFNQSGGSWTRGRELGQFPGYDRDVHASAFDLLGSGTAALVWSSALPGDTREPLRYIDLTGGIKPYLLTSVANSLGAQSTLTYAPSTKFYLQDRAAGTPWVTRLPFPVHVVERVETSDAVSRTSYVAQYSYHHGYYDGVEREFRGFARVETLDTDTVPAQSGIGTFSSTPQTVADEFVLPPVWTRTWFHTGAFFEREDIAARLAAEYYAGDPHAPRLATTILPATGSAEELREACRALRGRILREEVYAQDGTPAAVNPYLTRERRYEVDRLQPTTASSYGVFYAWQRETVACDYERNPADPRVSHELALAIDAYGNLTREASVGYPRRAPAYAEQGAAWVRYREHEFADVAGEPDWYRLGLPVETREYQLTGVAPEAASGLYDPVTLAARAAAAAPIPYEQTPQQTSAERRLLARTRLIYRRDDLSAALPLGEVQRLALLDARYSLRYTPGLLEEHFATKLGAGELNTLLGGPGAFVDLDKDGNRWAPSSRLFYSPDPQHPEAAYAQQHFYLPQGALDPWNNATRVAYDDHDLLPVSHTDALGNTALAQSNYRVLAPWLLTDPNLNLSGVRYDALGMVSATAALGKPLGGGGYEGDYLDTSTAERAPSDDPTAWLEYDLGAFAAWAAEPGHDPDRPRPVWVKTRTRERHKDPATTWLSAYAYSDGAGRVALTKAQAEPGEAPVRDEHEQLVRDGEGKLMFAPCETRWVGSGRTVYDNKGNAVKTYEPFFDSGPVYTDESDLAEWGVTSITRYDPLSRPQRIDNPNGTLRTVEFDPWHTVLADENDTVLQSAWYAARSGGAQGALEAQAATKAAAHAGTPASADLDSLGRTFRCVADNSAAGQYTTLLELDIDGRALSTTDAHGRTVLTLAHDLAGAVVHSASVDAGECWMLADSAGAPLQAWDARGAIVRPEYDALRRRTSLHVTAGGAGERVAEQTSYGEALANAQELNLRGAPYQHRDGAGIATTELRDFKGNVLRASRQLLSEYRTAIDWALAPALEAETFTTSTTYDALNRALTVTTPDESVSEASYNQRSLLAAMAVKSAGAGAATSYVSAIAYDAKAQRQQLTYGNGAITKYSYDPLTFRLTELQSTRPGGGGSLQQLTYTYDPAGNVTHVHDAAQQTIFFDNQVVTPDGDYTYDPIYRLVQAEGREHIGQSAGEPIGPSDLARVAVPLPSDAQAMRNYTQRYAYDAVGNIEELAHIASGGGFKRVFAYDEPTAPPANNQLTSSTVGGTREPYAYDANGNVEAMPHLSLLRWDWNNQLEATATQIVGEGTPATTYYRYDAGGTRVRKVTDNQNGARTKQRVYLGPYEIYREYGATGAVTLERRTLHIAGAGGRICLLETTTLDAGEPQVAEKPATLTRYQLGNLLGSAVLELDQNAAIITYEEYYPYGSSSLQSGRSAAEVSLKRYRYTGKERDEESGFYYHGARYYVPWLARWTRPDPAGFADGVNMYGYCRENPIGARDSTGHQQEHVTAPHGHITPISTSHSRKPQEAAQQARLSHGQGTPAEALSWFQTHGHPELQSLPEWNTSLHRWVFNAAPPPSQGSPPPPGAKAQGGATGGRSEQGGDRAGLAPTASGGRVTAQEIARPESVTGTRPSGTLHLWSGDGKAEAQTQIKSEGKGWMMGDIEGNPTPQHAAAETEWNAVSPKYPPGAVPEPIRNKIWGPPSANVVGRGAFAGHPVEAHGTPKPNSIQITYEAPARAWGGGFGGGLGFASGMFTALSTAHESNPAVQVPLIMTGVSEATAGIIYGSGAILGATEAMAIGSAGMTLFGGAGAAIGFGVASERAFARGDNLGGTVNALGALGGVLMVASLFTPVGWIGLAGVGLVALATGFNIGRWLSQ
jgi:RHS repeat-associated protein